MRRRTRTPRGHHAHSAIFCALALAAASGCDESGQAPARDAYVPLVSTLLAPAQLKKWIDAGHLDERGQKVVILDTGFDLSLNTRPDYDAGHLPGAYFVTPVQFYQGRSEGHILVPATLPDGPTMDALLQKHGIDGKTTVVLASNHVWGTARAYYALRYWGFPRSSLFLLNGKKSVWTAAGYALQKEEPQLPAPSTFSVSSWPGNMDELKVSTRDFMAAAEGKRADVMIVDARSAGEWGGFLIPPGDAAFGFRVKGSVWKEWATALVGGEGGEHVFKDAATQLQEFEAIGVTRDKSVYAFCQAAGRAAVHFVVFDAVLGRPIKLHAGSSYELGQLGFVKDQTGKSLCLPEDSPWRFDLDRYSSVIKYNEPAKIKPPTVVDAYDAEANLVAKTDKAYYKKP